MANIHKSIKKDRRLNTIYQDSYTKTQKTYKKVKTHTHALLYIFYMVNK